MKTVTNVVWLLSLISLLGCQTELKTEAAYFRWLNQAENGLVQVVEKKGTVLKAKFLPSTYLAYKEIQSLPATTSFDSLHQQYDQDLTFTISIEITEGNPMYKGVSDYADYQERVNVLNFSADQHIYLKSKGKIYYPTLHTFENTYNVSQKKLLYVVFNKTQGTQDILKAEEVTLVFDDKIFNTGKASFNFKTADLTHIPTVTLIEKLRKDEK